MCIRNIKEHVPDRCTFIIELYTWNNEVLIESSVGFYHARCSPPDTEFHVLRRRLSFLAHPSQIKVPDNGHNLKQLVLDKIPMIKR